VRIGSQRILRLVPLWFREGLGIPEDGHQVGGFGGYRLIGGGKDALRAFAAG